MLLAVVADQLSYFPGNGPEQAPLAHSYLASGGKGRENHPIFPGK